MNRRTWIGVLAIATLSAAACEAHAQFGNLFRRGPKVDVVSTSELANMMKQHRESVEQAKQNDQSAEPADFVVVDVRSKAETQVSVIPGAITKAQFEQDREKYDGRLVVPYCTVGGRSGAYAKQLAEDGVKVKNYKGSILDWVKNELPLVTLDGKPTNRVHTYSAGYQVPNQYKAVH